jgi:hypothetical protein
VLCLRGQPGLERVVRLTRTGGEHPLRQSQLVAQIFEKVPAPTHRVLSEFSPQPVKDSAQG